jgi:hypothetical protein
MIVPPNIRRRCVCVSRRLTIGIDHPAKTSASTWVSARKRAGEQQPVQRRHHPENRSAPQSHTPETRPPSPAAGALRVAAGRQPVLRDEQPQPHHRDGVQVNPQDRRNVDPTIAAFRMNASATPASTTASLTKNGWSAAHNHTRRV